MPNVTLPSPPSGSLNSYLSALVQAVQRAFLRVVSADEPAPRVILQSPDATNYALTISDDGALTISGAKAAIKGTLATANVVLPFADATDKTKVASFDLSGITTATTRAFAFPDAAGTIALTSDIPTAFGSIKVTTFASSGTYTPDANLVAGYAVVKGGGGGGGGGAVTPTISSGCGGGGEGNTCIKWFTPSDVSGGVTVTVGAGGTGVAGTTGNTGGTTSLGSLCVAFGGTGGAQFGAGVGPSAVANVGDVIIYGVRGGQGMQGTVSSAAVAAPGYGGGPNGGFATMDGTSGTFNTGGSAAANSGGGGGGASSYAAGPGNIVGGDGGSGYAYIVEYLSA